MKNNLSYYLKKADFALEREMIRVDGANLATTPHPSSLGNKSSNPYITTDFGEQQIEIITPMFRSIDQLANFIDGLYTIVAKNINDELLWPNSMPPILPDKIEKARFNDGSDSDAYRDYLEKKYGSKVQMISGIHFNFSFVDEFIDGLYSCLPFKGTKTAFRDEIYLRIVRNYSCIKHLFIALTAATPNCDDSFQKVVGRSIRNSKFGYRNFSELQLSYVSTLDYVSDIFSYMKKGEIEGFREVYKSVRLKGIENKVCSNIVDCGIKYLEFRDLDINPFFKSGVDKNDLKFLHLIIIYSLFADDLATSSASKDVYLTSSNDNINDEIENLFQVLNSLNEELNLGYENIIKYKKAQYDNNELPYQKLLKEDYIDFNYKLATKYKQEALNTYSLNGYDDLELSTQILIQEAILHGLDFTVVDREANLVKLRNNFKEEYIFQATKTSADNFASILLMENKLATKEILKSNCVKVAKGGSFTDFNEALHFANDFNGGFVVKPNNTNFGLGISIFAQGMDSNLEEALKIAFSYDKQILIEEYFAGTEYRFLIVDNKVEGILHREPANVIGDGKHTIAELISLKNKDSKRSSKGYIAPLRTIEIDEHVKFFLEEQGLTTSSVPKCGKKVFLRRNSNISTGGDSIDVTDRVHDEYKEIALACARALDVCITGIDIIIPNDPSVFDDYCVIEANFNPAIHIHTYPHIGEARKPALSILKTLELI